MEEKNINNKVLVYTAASKHLFYYRMFISKYVIDHDRVPLNPFMIFDYFLADLVDKDKVREGNNAIISRSDEIWVFGPISNGVLVEINLAKQLNKPIKYFKIIKPHQIVEVKKEEMEFENEFKEYRGTI